MTSQELLVWAPAVSAIATVFAVVVALFRESLLLRFRAPKLEVSLASRPPDCHKTPVVLPGGSSSPCFYFRMRVHNKGRSSADKVQVFAGRLLRKQLDGTFVEETSFLPMNLKWSHIGGSVADGIAPGMYRHCDLGFVLPPSAVPSYAANKASLTLETEVQPNTGASRLAPGEYRLDLRVAASNARPVLIKLMISHTGEWYEDEKAMLAQGTTANVVPS